MEFGKTGSNIISPVGRCRLRGAFITFLLLAPSQLRADLVTDPDFVDDLFESYIVLPCQTLGGQLLAQGWTLADITRYTNEICAPLFPGGFNSSGSYASTSNIGSVGAIGNTSESTAQQQTASVKDRLDEIKEEAARPDGGWGLLLSAQVGETERLSTNNEVGYDSDLEGVVIGGDYRFNDRMVLGAALGVTADEADYDDNAGFLDTDSTTLTLYSTYLLDDNSYIDWYLGIASLEYDNSRDISVTGDPGLGAVALSGSVTSKFDGDQVLLGASYGYNWFRADHTYGVTAGLDYTETTIDAHDEDGNTNLELDYEEQDTESLTVTLGANWSYRIDMGWGVLVPNAGVAAVFQTEDDADISEVRLVNMPAVVPFLELETDEPDSEYALISLGVVLASNRGNQYFVTYEKIESNDLLENWALSGGFLTEF